MSHAVIRGKPNASQLYLDTLLVEARKSLNNNNFIKERRDVNLAGLIYYSLKQRLKDIFMINGATGERFTNEEILIRAVPLARALADKYESGTIVMFVMRNHQHMAVVYYASFFANVVPLPIEPDSTLHELRYFLTLVSPRAVFCDLERFNDVKAAVNEIDFLQNTTVIISNDNDGLNEFYKGYSTNLDSYQVSQASAGSEALLISTSGSSGLPKATVLTNEGLVAQLPGIWSYSNKFPQPTKLALLLSTAQWITHYVIMSSSPLYGVVILMTPKKSTVEHVLEIVEKFQPTWALLGPNFAKNLAVSATPGQLNSLEIVMTAGASLTENIVVALKEKLSKSAVILNVMGITELQGVLAMPTPGMHWTSNGHIVNIVEYKIVDENGKELGPNEQGELNIKSDLCIFKHYYNNTEAYREVVTADGWYMTGDIFYQDNNQELFFVERKKFWFKYRNYQIAPEEVERVISTVPGILESVVVESDDGPAAIVIRTDSAQDDEKLKEEIHNIVNSTLSDYKRLRGGIIFVNALPCTHSGKINRRECKKLVQIVKDM